MRVAVVEICRPEGVVMRCAWAVKARTSAKFTFDETVSPLLRQPR